MGEVSKGDARGSVWASEYNANIRLPTVGEVSSSRLDVVVDGAALAVQDGGKNLRLRELYCEARGVAQIGFDPGLRCVFSFGGE
jgi:hypothetical protein